LIFKEYSDTVNRQWENYLPRCTSKTKAFLFDDKFPQPVRPAASRSRKRAGIAYWINVVLLFRSAIASQALFWLYCISLCVEARFLRLCFAAGLTGYSLFFLICGICEICG